MRLLKKVVAKSIASLLQNCQNLPTKEEKHQNFYYTLQKKDVTISCIYIYMEKPYYCFSKKKKKKKEKKNERPFELGNNQRFSRREHSARSHCNPTVVYVKDDVVVNVGANETITAPAEGPSSSRESISRVTSRVRSHVARNVVK